MRLDNTSLRKQSTWRERTVEVRNAGSVYNTVGGHLPPPPPRGLNIQAAPRSAVLGWELPAGPRWKEVRGYRVYQSDETSLVAEIRDYKTRTIQLALNAGASPVPDNFFVATVGLNGKESQKVWIQGAALAEAGAPAQPPKAPTTPIFRINKYYDG